ncbi:hypothetical protein M9Y10_007543 [Tritrichomonas musculus]|uniref:Uncharacterized protein n=1 Tax=Tritrichomonas musculus TaxID=1915356 RepID=A0ABR2J1M4_9EUKA
MPSGCGDLLIAGCNFKGLHSWKFGQHSGGGALYVEQKCTVLLHECIFDDCHADNHGGALFIVEKFNGGNVDTDAAFNDDEIPKLTTEFCCFQDCYIYGESNSNSNSKHGVAMYVAALETNISFLTTVRCPGNDGVLHRGAQFDIQSRDDIYSSNINTTGGHSLYCSGIEYRHSKKGVFRFQTVTNIVGKFATSLTSLTVVVDISYCNYLSNTVYYKKVDDADYAALIHVRFSDAKLNNFYFVNTSFKYDNQRSEMVKIIASEFAEINKEHKKRAIVTDCYTDETGNPDLFVIQSGSINYLNKAQFTTCTIQQLFLGDCKGVKKPDAIIITPIFTHSAIFSCSKEFSESDSFTETGKFTKTDAFSKTSKFSKSDVFSQTNGFSDTDMFSESGLFSNSNSFSQSDDLNRSKIFSSSKKFTKSDYFSKSGFFSDSRYFTSSGHFSKSGFFSD